MSSQQVYGAVGAVIGAVVGYFFWNPYYGASLGYSIGAPEGDASQSPQDKLLFCVLTRDEARA